MSLDERMRAGTRAAAGSRPIDGAAAWEQVQQRSHRAHTRRNVVLTAAAAAAVVAGVVWGTGIVDSLSGQGEVAPVDQPTDEAVVEDGFHVMPITLSASVLANPRPTDTPTATATSPPTATATVRTYPYWLPLMLR